MNARVERLERAAFRAFYGPRAHELGGGVTAYRADEAPASLMLNRAVGLGHESAPTDEALDAVEAALAGTTAYVAVAPGPHAADLRSLLAGRGYEPGWGWMQFTRGVEPSAAPATGLEVVEVADAATADAAARVIADAYGLPPAVVPWFAALPASGWTLVAALDGATVAGAAALFAADRAAYLGFAGTAVAHRGRGAQGALLAERIRRAAALGCDLVVTETGERLPDRPSASYRNILRAGFSEAYVVENWRRASGPPL